MPAQPPRDGCTQQTGCLASLSSSSRTFRLSAASDSTFIAAIRMPKGVFPQKSAICITAFGVQLNNAVDVPNTPRATLKESLVLWGWWEKGKHACSNKYPLYLVLNFPVSQLPFSVIFSMSKESNQDYVRFPHCKRVLITQTSWKTVVRIFDKDAAC